MNVNTQGAVVNYYFTNPSGKGPDAFEKDLKSGDMDSAKTSLASHQQNMAGALSNMNPPLVDTSNLSTRHVEALAGAMASGDVIAAQKLEEEKKEDEVESAPHHLPNEGSDESPPQVIYSADKGNVSIPPKTGERFFVRV
ncbi:MAG: hypothetical protein B9S32_04530 [Verrucomicrobia bacterium Tous-C9LFEB]|nr:MAG: hypothetical protein B9S32_04530 [Verrucomicrobia bacterium Tous-C9LFEB]